MPQPKKVTAKEIRAAVHKRLPIKSDKALNEILEFAGVLCCCIGLWAARPRHTHPKEAAHA